MYTWLEDFYIYNMQCPHDNCVREKNLACVIQATDTDVIGLDSHWKTQVLLLSTYWEKPANTFFVGQCRLSWKVQHKTNTDRYTIDL